MVLPCRPLGVVELDQEEEDGQRERNDRVIVMPAWHDRVGEFEHPSDFPTRLKEEIEQFFLSTTFFTGKKARDLRLERAEKSLLINQRV